MANGPVEPKIRIGGESIPQKRAGSPPKHLLLKNRIEPGPYVSREALWNAVDTWLEITAERELNGYPTIEMREFCEFVKTDPLKVQKLLGDTGFQKVNNAKTKSRALIEGKKLIPLMVTTLQQMALDGSDRAKQQFLAQAMDFLKQLGWEDVKVEDAEEGKDLEGPKIIKQVLDILGELNGGPVNAYIVLPRLVENVGAEQGTSAITTEQIAGTATGDAPPEPDGPDPVVGPDAAPTPSHESGAGQDNQDNHPVGVQ